MLLIQFTYPMRSPILCLLMLSAGCRVEARLSKERETDLRATHFYAPRDQVREAAAQVFEEWGLAMRQADAAVLRTKKVQEGPLRWRLVAEIEESGGVSSLVTHLELYREAEFDVHLSETALFESMSKLFSSEAAPETDPERRRLQASWQACLESTGGGRPSTREEWERMVRFRETLLHRRVLQRVQPD